MGIRDAFTNDDTDALQEILGSGEEVKEEVKESTEEPQDTEESEEPEETEETEEGQSEESKESEEEEESEEESEEEAETEESEEEEEAETEESEEEETEEEESEEEAPAVDDNLLNLTKKFELEGEFENNEAIVKALEDKMETDTEYRKASEKANQQLLDLIEGVPELKGFLQDLHNGADPKTAYALNIDESMAPEEDEEVYEKFKERKKEREKALEKKKELKQRKMQNDQKSQKVVKAFQETHKMDENQLNEFMKQIDDHFSGILDGTVSPDLLEVYRKGLNYDNDLKTAQKKGEVMAKNQRAIAKKAKEKGDGLPRPKKATRKETPKRKDEFDRWLDQEKEGRIF